MDTIDRDVVIIGAGPSGLTAARRLARAGKSVAVLEARGRVGGRTETRMVEGQMFEIGGQWISPDQTALTALVEELGLETFSRHRGDRHVYIAPSGERREYEGDWFPVSERTKAEMEKMIAELDRLAAEVGAEEPWAHPQAKDLDGISFHHWLRTLSDDEEACDNIGIFVAGGMLTKPARTFSALQAVLMAASAGSFSNLVDEDFILDKRVVGGMQGVSIAMANELGDDVVFLDNPVRTLEWSDNGPGRAAEVIATGDRLAVRARHAIMAVPPNLYSRVSYVPPLPRRQMIAHQHLSMGLVIKVHATYETPFWREDGLDGTCFGAGRLVQEIYDNSNHGEERGTLVGFIVDRRAEEIWAIEDDAERKRAVLEGMVEYLGERCLEPVAFYLSDWGAEEWTRGAYATSYDLGGLERWGAIQDEPVGPIFFSSSDIATDGYQHVDGAVRMGERTAARILEAEERSA